MTTQTKNKYIVGGIVIVIIILVVGIFVLGQKQTLAPSSTTIPPSEISSGQLPPPATPITTPPAQVVTPPVKTQPTPPVTAKKCIISGCSNEVCVDASKGPVITDCVYNPSYACYKTAKCEVQANDECGWTQTPALMQCIASSQSQSSSGGMQPQ